MDSVTKLVENLDKYFTSCNSVQVTKATISSSEWDEFRAALDSLMFEYCPKEMSEYQVRVWAEHQEKHGGHAIDS